MCKFGCLFKLRFVGFTGNPSGRLRINLFKCAESTAAGLLSRAILKMAGKRKNPADGDSSAKATKKSAAENLLLKDENSKSAAVGAPLADPGAAPAETPIKSEAAEKQAEEATAAEATAAKNADKAAAGATPLCITSLLEMETTVDQNTYLKTWAVETKRWVDKALLKFLSERQHKVGFLPLGEVFQRSKSISGTHQPRRKFEASLVVFRT